jgi:hypothetical protein
MGSAIFVIAGLAAAAYAHTAAVVRGDSGLSEESASHQDTKEVGAWIRRQQDRRVKIMDLETPLAFHADAEYVHFPYSNAQTVIRFLDAEKVDYVILRRGRTFAGYYDDWLTNGIPNPKAKFVYAPSGHKSSALMVFMWERNSAREQNLR